jgi:hypothetical protein
MTDLKKAAQQALVALIDAANVLSAPMFADAVAALRTALEQQAGPGTREGFNDWWNGDYDDSENPHEPDSAAYWAWAGWQAAKRPWVGLEAEEILDLFDRNNVYGSKWIEFARTVEAKLRSKNDH